MPAIVPDMRKAALIRQDPGRPHVPNHERTPPMMSQPLADVVFTEATRAEIASIATNLYQQILLEVQGVEALLRDAGVSRPPEAAELCAFLLPRQVQS